MANYREITKHHPQVRDYIRLRKWVHRGETIAYGANLRSETLSTDQIGYRLSIYRDRAMSVTDCLGERRYGIVMGPSNVYGFGLPSDAHTISSRLANMLGMPFGNVSLPEGHSKNLFGILLNIVTRSANPPAIVLLLNGGDFTSWAYSGVADPVFGPPNLLQVQAALKERNKAPDPAHFLKSMMAASQLWTGAIVQLCQMRKIPIVMGNDTTFFEKDTPSDRDRECELGVCKSSIQARQFAIHREHGSIYYHKREEFAHNRGVELVGPGSKNRIGFIDEFHYDSAGVDTLCEEFAPALDRTIT